ncbi:hypothetical protein T281_12840 [Rhodomicrobium udaipurense JA643]|uniref:Uncharacterized protein n=1 Tax=Rhodomicrobium udaipurense TaxID=1202716 RepID=A0A8I1GE42_9HYPH|nr:hypothetical protein [Rhodomicrobium udaipurense]KAI94101.1 hypothetical protein T281_12840 [Rhodomicrobium udaipurense JA643]MBJ7543259.1 hypothetical protein [Rhodomicrobium udaipurense]
MSLVGLVLRIATVKALAGRTFAEGRVYDSRNSPLDDHLDTEPGPFVAVYTDDDDATVSGGDLFASAHSLSLVFEIGIASPVVTTEAGEQSITIPHTDEGMEAALDVLRFQIVAALQHGDGVWLDLWRRLVIDKKSLSIKRGGSVKKGIRFAGREMVLTVDTIGDPSPGVDTSFWDEIEAALRGDTDTADIADLIRSLVHAGDGWPEWRKAAAILGISAEGRKAVGVGPMEDGAADAVASSLTVDFGDGRVATETSE